MVRIERLPEDAQEVLRVLAAGRALDHALLAEAGGPRVGARCARRCARRSAGHVIVADDEGNYAFRHALLREVVHDDLLPGEHAELHLALARALEQRMQAQGGSARLAAGDRPPLPAPPATSRRRFAAAVRAADEAERGARPRRGRARCYERALQLW